MKYRSTRGGVTGQSFEQALFSGYAADGGILLPESVPAVPADLLRTWAALSYTDLVKHIIPMFVSQDEVPADDLNGKLILVDWL